MGETVLNEQQSLSPRTIRESSKAVARSSYSSGARPTSLTSNSQRRPLRATMDFRPDFARPPPPVAMSSRGSASARHHDVPDIPVDVDPSLDEKLLEDIIFLFNNLSGSNVVEKALELKNVFCRGSPSLLVKFVRYFVAKRVCLEPNNHLLLLQLLNCAVGGYLVDMVRDHAIQVILLYVNSPDRSTSIPDKSAFKALGNWIGLTTYGIGKPLDRNKLDLQKILLKCNKTTIVSTLPMVCRLLAHVNTLANLESPDVQKVFYLLQHLHNDPDISMNLKFEIEALFTEIREKAKHVPAACTLPVKQSQRLAPYQHPPPPVSHVSSECSQPEKKPEQAEIVNGHRSGLDPEAEEYLLRFDSFPIVIRPALTSYSPKFFKLLIIYTVRKMISTSLAAAKEVADSMLGRLLTSKRDLAAFEETLERGLLRPIAHAMFPNMNQENFKLHLTHFLSENIVKYGLAPTHVNYVATTLTEDNISKALEYISKESCKLAFGMIQDLVKITIMKQRSNASRQSPPVMYGSYLTPVSPFDMLTMAESHPCAAIPQTHYPTVANPPPGHAMAAYPSPAYESMANLSQSPLSRVGPSKQPESYEQCFQQVPRPPSEASRISLDDLCSAIVAYIKDVIHPLFKSPVKAAILQSYHDLEHTLNSFLSLPCKTAQQIAILVDKTVYMFLTAFTEPPLPSHQDKSTFCSVFFHLVEILRTHINKTVVASGATNVVIEAVKTGRFNQEALLIMIKKGVLECDRIDKYVVEQMLAHDSSAIVFARQLHRAYGTSNIDQFYTTFPGIYRQVISLLREY